MMNFCQLLRALDVALAALEEVQRRDGLEDQMEENVTRCSRKKPDMSMYVRLGAGAAGG